MSTVCELTHLDHGRSARSQACLALSEVLPEIAQLVSQIETRQISSTEELRRALSVLDYVSTCARSIVDRYMPSAASQGRQLLSQCNKIDQLIASARMQTSSLNDL